MDSNKMKNKTKILSVIAGALFVLGAYVFTNNSTTNILGAISVTIPSAPGTGYIPFSSSTGAYSPYLLVAGTGVSIATSSGQITISASTGSFTTTTINGVSATSFTFNTSGSNGLSYSTSTGVITLTQATSSASQSGFLSSTDWSTFNGKQDALTFPFPYASTTHGIILGGTGISASTDGNGTTTITNIGVTSIVAGTDITVSNSTGTVTVGNTYASSTYLKVANNLSDLQSTSTARTNLGVDVTKATNIKTIGFNVFNATSSATATTTIQRQFYQNSTLSLVSCSTNGSNITIAVEKRASSTPDTAGTSMLASLVCGSTGNSTSTFATSTIAENQILTFLLTSVPNSTTTLRTYTKFTND